MQRSKKVKEKQVGSTSGSAQHMSKTALVLAYIRDARLLILDEPTSALDAWAEHEAFQQFSDSVQGKSGVQMNSYGRFDSLMEFG